MLLARFAFQGVVLLLIAAAASIPLGMRREVVALLVLRTVLHIIGIGAMFVSLRYLPLADALAICFVLPFILLLFGRIFAGEEVGPRRVIACSVGFAGTLLVIQPSFAAVGAPALLPLVVAVTFSLFMMVTRKVAKEIDPIGLQAVSGVIAVLLLGVLAGVGATLDVPDLVLVQPSARDAWLLAFLGVLGTVAHLMMTWSLRFAPSATLAPVQYLEIAFGTLIGWIVFGDLPNGLAALGMAIIVAAGLYVVLRERKVARALAVETTTI